ncbi:hypothetical protein D9615_005614 [Tricholomella constricta]|uniref:Uncharacterized protein n=1 Tax=Tricholomella constricta TaxID=117010 RepID=A0A8H5HDI7_9AGAR|nr:hypothetical protein D9615_005614 [Tricholomella constricta]
MKHSIMFCKAWILLQSYLSIICYLSSHAVVAIRVNALHNGQITIKRLLWIGGISYALSTFAILTAAYPAIIALVKTSTSKGACVSKIPSYLWVAWMPTIWAQAPPTLIAVSRPRRVSAESEGAFAEHKSQGPGVSGPGFEFVVHSRDAQSAPGVEYPL